MDVATAFPLPMQAAPRPGQGVNVLVLGIGNTLLGDDGVGVHAVRCLAATPRMPAWLQPLDGGTLGFRLIDIVMGSGAVLFIDAAELGAPAGARRLLEQCALDAYLRHGVRRSAHEAGLIDLLTLARMAGWAPTRLAVLGVQPQRIDWDEHLSDAVAGALPDVCRLATATALQWRHTA